MEFKIIDNSDKEMVRRRVKKYLADGWKPKGEIQKFVKYIPYQVSVTKEHPSVTYYQELIKEEETYDMANNSNYRI